MITQNENRSPELWAKPSWRKDDPAALVHREAAASPKRGVAADSHLVGGSGSRAGRRLIAVGAMFVGALVGSLLILHVSTALPLVIALIVVATIAATTRMLSRTDSDWVHAS